VAVNIDSFRRERPEDSFHGWLWRITRNKVNDHFRKKLKAPQAQGGSTAQALIHEIPVQFPNEPTTEDQERDHAAISRRILRLLEQDFEPRTWKAFWRVAVDEVPAKSAAEELNMTVGAVYNAKYKVLCRLRQELDGIA
ncbi:MAG: sigma-70 family RNA polymerase sigma factor, partial [Planctomycetaceae bacterium]|nr:sigma-70 family RNA polymerase sigma factor [Planctomycetaceae bacterium]